MFSQLSQSVRQYILITGNYWAFTLTDGALRMLVVLHFHLLGYTPLQIAMLFLFYEFFGVVTNLLGGWLGARWGLNRTMHLGLGLQVLALSMLLVPQDWLTVAWVMLAQAMSGIAKDLNKMSAKSAVKLLVSDDRQDSLYRWVAMLTGSKNTLKGIGFFLGGLLLTLFGFHDAILTMVCVLIAVWLISIFSLRKELGKSKSKPKFSQIFSKSASINYLSAARLFLFAARDIWFVVALPVFLSSKLGWTHWQVGGFLASWIVVYGIVQAFAPKLTNMCNGFSIGKNASLWCFFLSIVPVAIAFVMYQVEHQIGIGGNHHLALVLLLGLTLFGFLFAINSSLHSYLIIKFANVDNVSMDVGFYYMANASGRLFGTVLSGWIFQAYGFHACLIISSVLIVCSAILVRRISEKMIK